MGMYGLTQQQSVTVQANIEADIEPTEPMAVK